MPRYYRSSPATRPARPAVEPAAPRRRTPSILGPRQRRFDAPTLPILNPRRLLSNPPPTAKAQAYLGAPARPTVRVKPRRGATRRKWNASHVVASVVLLGAIATLVYVFIASDFYVYNADIQNALYTPADTIYQQAGVHGFSAFFINPTQVATRLEQLPHIRHAEAWVRLPNRIQILVEEREPALLYQVQSDVKWVDDDGVIAPIVAERQGLARLIDDAGAVQLDNRHIDLALLQAIRQITTNLPQVNTFRYQAPYGLVFLSPEGWRVYLGSAENMSDKLAAWEAIRQQLLKQKLRVQEVDLRYQRPYWR